MAVRRPIPVPNLGRGEWDEKKRRDLEELLKAIVGSLSGISTTPEDPTEVQAGVSADVGDALSVALSDHLHSIETAAPSVDVALSGAPDEGTGTALMRADATLVIDQGGAVDGDAMIWDNSIPGWSPKPAGFSNSVLGNRVFAMRQQTPPPADDSQLILASRIFGR